MPTSAKWENVCQSGGILALEVVCVYNKGGLMSSEVRGLVGVLPVTVAPISHHPLGSPMGSAQQETLSPLPLKEGGGAPVTHHPALLPFLRGWAVLGLLLCREDIVELGRGHSGQGLSSWAPVTAGPSSQLHCLLWFCRARPSCPGLGFLAQVWV